MNYLYKLINLLNNSERTRLYLLIVFSIFLSIIEVIGVAAIMPFIDIATNFDKINSNQYYHFLFNFLEFEKEVNFTITFGVVLFCFYIFRGFVNILYNYFMTSFSQNLTARLCKTLFYTYLSMPYKLFVTKNSSFLVKAIVGEAGIISSVTSATLLMISEALIIVFLYILMLIASWKITLIFTMIFSIKILFLTQFISKRIKSIGVVREKLAVNFFEIINKTFGNFKHIKLQDKDRIDKLKNEFKSIAMENSKVGITHDTLSIVPRLFLETFGFGAVVLLLVFLLYKQQDSVLYVLPTLSLFVLALYRLLPSVNRIINGYNTILFYHKSIDVVSEELKTKRENTKDKKIIFNTSIKLDGVTFKYKDSCILNKINLTIHKGEKIAFVGESGSGKSTLVDLIIGLHQPEQGHIFIDDRIVDMDNVQQWRAQIGYIPQQVYLFDGTVSQNVCFGREVDYKQLKDVLIKANIFDFLQTKKGIDTLVGEGGVQLSGGQKQRIAIARALYGNPEVLVLDEATSALDTEIEKKIMNEIYKISKDKTLIIIAHRLTTIEGCDKVYKLKNGVINVK